MCGVHNHPPATYLEGHPFLGRLSSEETTFLVDMSSSSVPPKSILVAMKQKNSDNATTMKTIYNMRHKLKVKEKAGRSQMQFLLSKLAEKNYIEYHTTDVGTDYVKDLFWAHPVSIDLLRTFPRVLIMDCTYKTNRYQLPLLEIVGITSTEMTYSVAFAFLHDEKEASYIWALDRLLTLMDPVELPQVIVTDRELTLINAIGKVFTRATHMLCSWHIQKNIASKCKKMFETKQKWDKFNSIWKLIVYSSNEQEYNQYVSTMCRDYATYPEVTKYIFDTWLSPYKEKFVAAWTDNYMHFGNTTTNRVESSHSRLKKQLSSSQGNFETTWTTIDSLLAIMHTNIKASFEKSKTVVQHNYQPSLFKYLRGNISMSALNLIVIESNRADSVGLDDVICGCVVRRTRSLPCAHEIAEYKRDGRPIPLERIDVHWTRLAMLTAKKIEINCLSELDLLRNRFNQLQNNEQIIFLQKIRELACPDTTNLIEPQVKTITRGRPSSKKFRALSSTKRDPSYFEHVDFMLSQDDLCDSMLRSTCNTNLQVQGKNKKLVKVHRTRKRDPVDFVKLFPMGLRPWILKIKDVRGDGNCGYRAIASLMGFGENEWIKVRKDMLEEIKAHEHVYRRFYWADEFEEVVERLTYFDETASAPESKWLQLPEMGYIIASCYNIVLYTFSNSICCTFFPILTVPDPIEIRKEIVVGFVHNNHFVEMFMKSGHPIPPIAYHWDQYANPCALSWQDAYTTRIEQFKWDVNPTMSRLQDIISLESDNDI